MRTDKKFKLSVIGLFLLLFLIIMYFSIVKKGYHMDELLSYGLANNYFEPFPYDGGEWLPQNYYQNYLIPTTEAQFEYGSVIYNQAQDVHPPIYYILLHTLSSFFPSVFSKWIGLSLNIFIYLLSSIMLYKVTKQITNDKWISLIAVLFWGASIGAISTVMFIRMYALLTLANILLVYITIKYFDHEKPINIFLFLTFLVIILGGLTQYYFFIFAFFLTVVVFILMISKKSFIKSLLYPIVALLSVISSFIIFPAMYNHVINTNRGNEVFQNSAGGINFKSLNVFIDFIYNHLFGNIEFLFILGVIVLSIITLGKVITRQVKGDKFNSLNFKKINYFIIVFVPAILFLVVVQQISGMKVSRYIYAIYPFIALSFILFLWFTLNYINSKTLINKIIIFVISIIFIVAGLSRIEPNHLYKEAEQTQEISKGLSDLNAVVLLQDNERWKINHQINELRHYNRVYPMLISNMDELPADEIINNSEDIVINISTNLDSNQAREQIENYYNFDNNELLYSHHSYNAYLFEDN